VPTVTRTVKLAINGVPYERSIEPRLLLVHLLRDVLGLTGTHVGCETSLCGACTVTVNGAAVKSCTMFAVQADGAEVGTIEGLAPGDSDSELHPVQEGFWERHGLQCGFCTPGMIMTAAAYLKENPSPSERDIRHSLDGNFCRCTGYVGIVDGVRYAVEKGGAR